MSNIFTKNPIKINIISKTNVIKQTIIFIGLIDNNIKNILIDIEKKYNSEKKIQISKKDILKLKNIYGLNWEIKLGIKTNNYKKGGSNENIFNFQDNIESKLDISNELDGNTEFTKS